MAIISRSIHVLVFIVLLLSIFWIGAHYLREMRGSIIAEVEARMTANVIREIKESILAESETKVVRTSNHSELQIKSTAADGELGTISPPALPSVLASNEEEKKLASIRKYYGGANDKLHLGGFLSQGDPSTLSPNTFNWMLSELAIKKIVDLGCGRGFSTNYFLERGAEVLCVEGSHDAVKNSLLPKDVVVEHDFTRGPWWPEGTWDAVWCVEFVEHIQRQFIRNYLPVFRRAALVFVSFGISGGHHHVEVKEEWWWKSRFTAAGLEFSEDLTARVRRFARADNILRKNFTAQHIMLTMMVFINRPVAQLPAHDYLFGGLGCLWGTQNVPCSPQHKWFNPAMDTLPARMESLLDCQLPAKGTYAKGSPYNDVWNCTHTNSNMNINGEETLKLPTLLRGQSAKQPKKKKFRANNA